MRVNFAKLVVPCECCNKMKICSYKALMFFILFPQMILFFQIFPRSKATLEHVLNLFILVSFLSI